MSMIIDGTLGATFNDGSLQAAAASPFSLKNRIINGDMRIDQRNAGAATANTINGYTLDRWQVIQSVTGKLIAQQNAAAVTPPTGFTNYLGVTSQSSYSILTGDYYAILQPIEGYNIADLDFGKATAKTVTLSFWVRSSLTGTFSGSLRNSATDRCFPFTYTISVANTWEQKSVTIAGDTSGTWLTTNGIGLYIWFSLGTGSTFSGTAGSWQASNLAAATGATSVVGTNGATFYITGVQLEQNTSATPFERRLYNQELANCQRYYWKWVPSSSLSALGVGISGNATTAYLVTGKLPVTMRVSPAIATPSNCRIYDGTTAAVTAIAGNFSSVDYFTCDMTTASGLTTNRPAMFAANNTLSASAEFSSEL
jgi:hypothetical protein